MRGRSFSQEEMETILAALGVWYVAQQGGTLAIPQSDLVAAGVMRIRIDEHDVAHFEIERN